MYAFFSSSLMVKVRNQSSNRNTVKQTPWKWPKNLGWPRRGRHYITGAGRQEFEAPERSWIRPSVIGSERQIIYVFPADHEHFELLAWPCMIARWHHWRHKRSHVSFFRCQFDRHPIRILTSDLHHRILRKNICQIRAYDFGVRFSFKNSFLNTIKLWIRAKKLRKRFCDFICRQWTTSLVLDLPMIEKAWICKLQEIHCVRVVIAWNAPQFLPCVEHSFYYPGQKNWDSLESWRRTNTVRCARSRSQGKIPFSGCASGADRS